MANLEMGPGLNPEKTMAPKTIQDKKTCNR